MIRGLLTIALSGALLGWPSAQPSAQPSARPNTQPTAQPTAQPSAQPAMPANVAEILKRTQINAKDIAFYAQAVDDTDAWVSINASEPFVLASTAKLVTAMSALELLGGDHRWRTEAVLSGSLRDGRLDGDLILVGGGDPLLDDVKLLGWFIRMQRRGLREINGNILIDRRAFRFNEKDFANTPKPSWDNTHHAYPDAFLVNEGQFELTLSNSAGGVRASLRPELADIKVQLSLANTKLACADRKKAVRASWNADSSTMVLDGEWSNDCADQRVEFAPWSNLELSQATVAMLWRKAGGVLNGTVKEADAGAGAANHKTGRPAARAVVKKAWMALESPPLLEALRQMNKWSNNVVSRHVFLSLSNEFPQRAATADAAQQALRNWLATRGLGADDIAVDNGSGLSRDERGQAVILARLLIDAWQSRNGRAFIDTLSVVGVDGTLGNRLKSSPVAGRAFMKSGTLTAVRAVAGYVHSRSGRYYAVVVNVNHNDAHRALSAIDAFIEWVYLNG